MNVPAVALALAFAVPAFAQDYVEPWSDCKEGSTTVFRCLSQFPGAAVSGVEVHTVKSAGRDAIEMVKTLKLDGVKEQEEQKWTTSLKGLPGSSAPAVTPAGEETLKIDGTDYACIIRSYKVAKGSIKAWLCKDAGVAGNALKVEFSTEGATIRTVRTATKLGALIPAGKGMIKCAIFEVETTTKGGTTSVTEWWSPDVPGFVAKRVMLDGKGQVATSEELREFVRK